MKRKRRQRAAVTPPAAFLARMRRLLGDDDYAQFAATLAGEAHSGLRINTLKVTIADFISKTAFRLSPVGAFEPAGFLVHDGERLGSHPYHAAGLYYLQDPSAMVVGGLLRPEPGELVLDLAAAPGGKATHLATLMADEGLLVANDVNRGRVNYLAQNLERWGAKNTLITNSAPERLASAFGPIFDKVLVDAPCSGEGMFRRQGEIEWSAEIVAACSRRQQGILDSAGRLVRPGGLLAYATCTFSPEENEEVIGRFLVSHDDFHLVELPPVEGSMPGRSEWIARDSPVWIERHMLRHTLRLWPHRFPGEGHFLAIMRRSGAKKPLQFKEPPRRRALSPLDLGSWHTFAGQTLGVQFPEDRFIAVKNRLYLRPERAVNTLSLRVVRYGLFLGEARKGYFQPAHTLAMALSPAEVKECVDWQAASDQALAYLAGENLASSGPDGWVLVTVDGHALGWAKRVNGRLKNHYPRGLRRAAAVGR